MKNGKKWGKKESKLRSKQWKGKAPVGRPSQSYVVVVVVAIVIIIIIIIIIY